MHRGDLCFESPGVIFHERAEIMSDEKFEYADDFTDGLSEGNAGSDREPDRYSASSESEVNMPGADAGASDSAGSVSEGNTKTGSGYAGAGSLTGGSAGYGYGGAGSTAGSSTGSGYGSAGSSTGTGYGYGSAGGVTGGSAGYGYGSTGSTAGSSAGYGYGSTGASAGSSAGYGYGSAGGVTGDSAGYGYGSAGSTAGSSAGYGYGSAGTAAGGRSGSASASSGLNSGYESSNAGTGSGSGQDAGRKPGQTANSRYYSYDYSEGSGRTPGTPPRKGSDRRKRGGRLAGILAVILVFVIGAGAGAFLSSRSSSISPGAESSSKSRIEGSSAGGENKDAAKDDNTEESGDSSGSGGNTISRVEDKISEASLSDTTVADVAERVMPAIVSVYNKYTEESQFFGRTYTQEAEAAGSGIIIEETDTELLIVTNNHVVAGADSLSVQFIDEENCEAALKGTDASSDLAVISVSLDALSAGTKEKIAIAELGDSDSLRIGDHAIAIGNALGYGQSLTVGYISALNREITSEDGITGTFIQTDAAINPGNSGGALLNSRGQVIGINSNKIGGEAIEGMGFAIPISKAIPIIDGLKTQESKTKVAEEDQGVLGILGISVTSDVASAYGLPVGAYVEEILEGSGAAQSELAPRDIITAINGQTITGMEDLQNQLAYYKAGEEVTLTVQHPLEGSEYEEREIKVTLSKKSDVNASSGKDTRGQGDPGNSRPSEDESGSGGFSFPFGF